MSHHDAKYFLDYDAINAIVWDRYAVEEAKGYLILLNDPSININVIIDGNIINFLFGYKLKCYNYNESHVKSVKNYISSLIDDVDNTNNIRKRNSLIFFYCYILRLIIKYHNYLLNPCYSCYYYWTVNKLLYQNIEEYFNHLSKSLENI